MRRTICAKWSLIRRKPTVMCCTKVIRAAVIVLLFARVAGAVNLVPNPSFETFTNCPGTLSQINFAVPWGIPTAGSSDYFNACASSASGVSVPGNTFGTQTAHTGVAYAGFHVRPPNPNYREYVQVALTSPLTAGQSVHVELWVTLASNSRDAIDRIGAYLSVGPVQVSNVLPLPNTPQVESPALTFLTSKTTWMQISGNFIAGGGEDHIIIGNFHDDTTTNVQQLSGSFPFPYYYVDDVTVEPVVPALQSTDTYAAKFICGVQKDTALNHIVDAQAGRYASKINVHNNTGVDIHFRKKVIRLRGGEVPISPSTNKPLEKLGEDQAMEVVCRDIYKLLNIPVASTQIPPYIEGFVILEVYTPPGQHIPPPDPLDVEGVYTYKGDLPGPAGPIGSGVDLEIVVYPPKKNAHVLH